MPRIGTGKTKAKSKAKGRAAAAHRTAAKRKIPAAKRGRKAAARK
jgi:hypothetical protein